MSRQLFVFTPVSKALREIEERYAGMDLAPGYADPIRNAFGVWASAAENVAPDRLSAAGGFTKVVDSIMQHLPARCADAMPSPARGGSVAVMGERVRKHKLQQTRQTQLIDVLLRASVCCMVARHPVVKPLRAWLDQAQAFCLEFDNLRLEHAAEDQLESERNRRAGRERHRKHRALRRLARWLLRSMAPKSGWSSKRAASRLIASRVIDIAMKKKLPVSLHHPTWTATIRDLIADDPVAARFYLAHSQGAPG